ncbi:polysaccharide lyase family 7 protein [Vibrio fortis]|jgi:poly(beta-D-mannuronate) lyase|uniref:polysaccharide lyase family 7 protein n=1 Tax=Vibrio fortis TaxID=212667 RepID=UPI0021C471D5|nr:polysaccharide lyase family 7 protein [Vibrio fortis]
MKLSYLSLITAAVLATPALAADNDMASQFNLDPAKAPAQNFDLSKWKINLPELTTEGPRKGKTLEIAKTELANVETPYVHPEWFYTDKETGAMVFVAPNTAPTTPNSKNTRSELRAMLGDDYAAPDNNFVVSSHSNAKDYGSIGGQMTATLSVDQVSTSGNYKKTGAFSVVIGQIHGSDNEPLKIVYRKLPEHEHGSLTWNYELNPTPELQNAKDDNGKKLRKDIRHDVFGKYNLKKGSADPVDGIKLGEVFSYDVDIKDTIMHLTFTKNPNSDSPVVKTYEVDLAAGNYQGHEVDLGYGQDWMYFKAGAYNQCNTKKSSSACEWRGMDAGDYTKTSFYQLVLNQ